MAESGRVMWVGAGVQRWGVGVLGASAVWLEQQVEVRPGERLEADCGGL